MTYTQIYGLFLKTYNTLMRAIPSGEINIQGRNVKDTVIFFKMEKERVLAHWIRPFALCLCGITEST